MAEESTSDLVWRAEVLAPLQANQAILNGRVHEQEEALVLARRDIEHARTKQRHAERIAAEATEKVEYMEGKLDVARRAAELAGEQLEALRAAELAARDPQRAAEAEAEARAESIRISHERLLLLARAHREQEEAASAGAAREAALEQRRLDAERALLEAEKRISENQHRVLAVEAAEAQWQAERKQASARLAQSEQQARQAASQHEAVLRETREKLLAAEKALAASEARGKALRQQRDDHAGRIDELKQSMRRHEQQAAERLKVEEELRVRLSRVEAERALLKESHAANLAEMRQDSERHRAQLAERQSEIARVARQAEEQQQQRKKLEGQLKQTAALGMQLQGIQSMLTELAEIDELS